LESLLGGDEELYAHISKPLQEKTAPFNFLRRMRHFMTPQKERKIVINADIDGDNFSWEHEPYFQNRISSLTLSHFPSADHVSRLVRSYNFTNEFRNAIINDVDPKQEARNLEIFNWRVQVISETLVSYIFGLNVDWCTEELQKSDNCHVIQPFIAIQQDSALKEIVSKPRPAVSLPLNLVNDLHKMVKNYCPKTEKRTFTASDIQLYGANGMSICLN
jgi:hypothetical protein